MTTRWRKVVRDLKQESGRSLLVVFAIAVGLAAVTALLASYAILTRELNEGYLATNPASFTIVTDRVDGAMVRSVLANRDVSDAEPRRVVGARIRRGTAPWKPLTLFVVEDYARIRVSTLQREKGAWPPAAGDMLVERDAFQVIGARIGDEVTVKTPAGAERRLRITGSVHDVGQAQARMENAVYGYVVAGTLPLLGEPPLLDAVNVLVARDRFDERHIRNVAAEVKSAIERSGHPVRRVVVPPPGKHPHAALMGMLLLAMAAFGLFILLLGCIIVANLLTVSMAAQVRQIGTMKAIGATRGDVARLYLTEAVLYGVAAIAVALPLGIAGSRALCRAMSVFLNFDIHSFAIPLWVFAVASALGTLVPLLAAAVPVWKGSHVPVRVALSDFGAAEAHFGAHFGENRLERLLARIGGAGRPLLLSIRNSFRRRGRLAITVLTLAIAGTLFMTALNVRASMIATLDRFFASKSYDMTAVLAAPVRWPEALAIINGTEGVARSARFGGPHGEGVRIVLRRHDPESADRVKASLERRLSAAGFNVAALASKGDNRYGYDQHLLMIYVFLIIVAVLIAAVGGLGLATAMSLNVLERRRELAVLRAIGATPARIAMMVAVEGVVISVMSWIVAIVIAAPLSHAMGSFLTRLVLNSPFEFRFPALGPVIWLLAASTLGAVASVLPAWGAAQRPVSEAIR